VLARIEELGLELLEVRHLEGCAARRS
jgi:hypothetical protein